MSEFAVIGAGLAALMLALALVTVYACRPAPPPDLSDMDSDLRDLRVAVSVIDMKLNGLSPRTVMPVRLDPKPHRHQWQMRSEEETNKQKRRIHVCRVEGCADTYVEETPQHDQTGGAA